MVGSLTPAFYVPMIGYLGVALFAIAAARKRPNHVSDEAAVVAGH